MIPCEEMEFIDEMKNAWHLIGRLRLNERENCQKSKKIPSQLNVWLAFLKDPDSAIQFPNVRKLIQVLLATPCNTSCVERGYSYLQMVCAPRRNHLKPENLETLFLLAALKLPVKTSMEYQEEIKILEK